VPCNQLMTELMDLVAEDADALGCVKEVRHVKTVLKRGTSAERQVKTCQNL